MIKLNDQFNSVSFLDKVQIGKLNFYPINFDLKEMPKNSSLQEKKSDYVGNSSFKIKTEKFNNSAFNIDYNYIGQPEYCVFMA